MVAMQKRGFNRKAVECRVKSQGLRHEYKLAIAENGKSGNNPRKCPSFDELDRILCETPSVRPLRISELLARQARK